MRNSEIKKTFYPLHLQAAIESFRLPSAAQAQWAGGHISSSVICLYAMRHALCAMLFKFRLPHSHFQIQKFPLPNSITCPILCICATHQALCPLRHALCAMLFQFRLPHSDIRLQKFPLPHSSFRLPHSDFPLPISVICHPTAGPRQTWLSPPRYPPRVCFYCCGSVGERLVDVQSFLPAADGLKTSSSYSCRTAD
jgi:hypothetical protein